jgi:hypothetical protein
MEDNFKTITDAFARTGIDITTAEYSITAYSLNTELSFRFDNLDMFLRFLGLDRSEEPERVENINSLLAEAGVDPNSFFFVNFYKPKVAEL